MAGPSPNQNSEVGELKSAGECRVPGDALAEGSRITLANHGCECVALGPHLGSP